MPLSKQCAGCGIEVARQDCHRNRYGEYICRSCQQTGFRYTKQKKRQYLLVRITRYALLGLAFIALAGALALAAYVLFDRASSPPAPPAAAE